MTCALCMIVKNEESTLPRCLDSVKGLFDEIIIVDTGSTDKTKAAAKEFTDKIFDFKWQDSFCTARNHAFSLAKTDYAMWLDADDILPAESRPELEKILSSLDAEQPDMVFLPYGVGVDDKGVPAVTFERERIIRLSKGFAFEGDIHEAIPPRGKQLHGGAAILHLGKENRDPTRNLRIFEGMIKNGRVLSPRENYYFARELGYAGRTEEAKARYLKCIDNPSAWAENRISACCELSELYIGEGDPKEAMKYLLKALEYAPPRSDMCCMLGKIFFDMGDYGSAEFWYSLAPVRFGSGGFSFIHRDYGGYIPYLQLAVIYDRKGDFKTAREFNELAGSFKPDGREYLLNKAYFEKLSY